MVDHFEEHVSVEWSNSKGTGPKNILVQERINLVQSQIENNSQTSVH